MKNSPLSRRGALAAVAGSAVALTVPATATATATAGVSSAGAAAPAVSEVSAASVNQLLSGLPEGHTLHAVIRGTGTPSQARLLAVERLATGDPYDTYGWDTVSAVRLTDVNQAIENTPDSFPSEWRVDIQADPFANAKTATGTFGVWRLVLGGSQLMVAMHVPFAAQVTTTTHSGTTTTTTVSGGLAHVQVHLDLLAASDARDRMELRVRTRPTHDDQPPVQVTSVTYTTPDKPSLSLDNALVALLNAWCAANLDQFRYVFATVSLGENGSGDLGWLRPTSTDYVYREGRDEQGNYSLYDSYMALLCMTEGRPAGNAEPQLANYAVLPDERAGLNISADRLMNKMVIPGLCRSFHTQPRAFQQQSDGSITSDSLKLDSITELGMTFDPRATYFRVGLEGGLLVMDMDVSIHVAPGTEATVSVGYSLAPRLAVKDGRQYIVFEGTERYRHTGMDVAWWAVVAEAILSLILGVMTVGAARVVETVVEAMALAALALLTQAALRAPDILAQQIPDELPSIDNLLQNTTSAIQWTNSKKFVVDKVTFDGGLRLGGTYYGWQDDGRRQ